MFGDVIAACEVFGGALARLDLAGLSPEECAQLADTLAQLETRCALVRALAAERSGG
jgi:hypothetical protein